MTAIEPARLFTRVTALHSPAAPYSLAVFRVLFGALMLVLVARYFAYGWIDAYFVRPEYHFKYPGFEWVPVWPAPWIYLHFVLMGLCALAILLGWRYQIATALFFVLFSHFHLMDLTIYLNHYYLVSLLSFLMIWIPAHSCWSLDAAREQWNARRFHRQPICREGHIAILRFQFACVYLFGAVAKWNPDWLTSGQPMYIWLNARTEIPLIGGFFILPETALLFSWAGMLFDLLVVPGLLCQRTRWVALAAAVAFHLMTALLFQIGMFPWIMIAALPLWFAPDWPLRLRGGGRGAPRRPAQRVSLAAKRSRVWMALAAFFVTAQIVLPLRWLVTGDSLMQSLWSERGFRFAWKIMLVQKSGFVQFRLVNRVSGAELSVDPRLELSPYQFSMMSTQPDMIQAYARHLAARYLAENGQPAAVFADARVAFNGRASQKLLRADIDLVRNPLSKAITFFH